MKDFSDTEYNAIYEASQLHKRLTIVDEDVLVLLRPDYLDTNRSSLVVSLSPEKILSLLEVGKTFPSEQIALSLCGKIFLLSESFDEEILAESTSVENLSRKLGGGIPISTKSFFEDLEVYSWIPFTELYSLTSPFYLGVLLLVGMVFAVFASYAYIVKRFVHKPINMLLDGFKAVERGDFSVRLHRQREDELSILFNNYNEMSASLEHLINENYVREIYAQRANYKQLQTQINPHFLYNSFFVLQRIIRMGDLEGADEFSSNLGRFYKFITKNSSDDVTLQEELNHTQIYAEIMKQRYGKMFECKIDCDPDLLDTMVPRLILQPILENVFVHGCGDQENPFAIEVKVQKLNEEQAVICVEDNGVGMEEERLQQLREALRSSGNANDSALLNIHNRLRLRFGSGAGIRVSNREEKGCRIELLFKYSAESYSFGN